MWPRLVLLQLFIVIFSASVTCAVVCPEQAIDPDRHQDRECTECISTHFVAGDKISDELIGFDISGVQNPVLLVVPPFPIAEGFLLSLSDTNGHPSPQSTITVFRI